MLLVDDDQADAAHRGEDRRPGPDDDPRLATRDPVALVAPLGVSERGVDDRHEVAEALPEAPDGLRRERDLRDEHDRPETALERRGARLEVDLGLAAARRALEQHVLAHPHVEGRDDPLDGRALIGRQRLRLGLAGERLAERRATAARRAALVAPARRARAPAPASSRSSRRPRARGRRASAGISSSTLPAATGSTPAGRATPTSETTPRVERRPKLTESTLPLRTPSGTS